MTEQEFSGYMIMVAICAPFLLLSWWLHHRQEAKDRRKRTRLNSNRVIWRAYTKKISRKDAADEIEADDAIFYETAKKYGIPIDK